MTDSELVEKVNELSYEDKFSEDVDGGEIQDVVDSQNRVIGQLPRGVIWDNGLQNQTRVVNVFVTDMEENILLPVRSMAKRYLPGGYDFSCGENLKAGEEYRDAAVRGLAEELGIKNEVPVEIGEFSLDEEKGIFCFGKVYLVEVGEKSEVVKFNYDEVERLEWRTKDQILEMIKDEPEKFKRDYLSIFRMAFG